MSDIRRVDNGKPKIGLVLVTSGWFREVGLQTEGSDTTARVEAVGGELFERIARFSDPVYPGVLFSEEEARKAGALMRSSGVTCVLLSPLMWCEDHIVRACLQELRDVPLILWSFTPSPSLPDYLDFQTMLRGSGTVCTLQLSGMLKREGYRYHSVAGHMGDEDVLRHIERLVRGFALKRSLSTLRVGVLPFPCAQMSTTYVDEFGLRNRYGIELRYIELSRVAGLAERVCPEDIASFKADSIRPGTLIDVDNRNLEHGIRYALALEQVIEEEKIAVLAMNDVISEMHTAFGIRPCLSNPRIGVVGTVVSMEADIAAGIAMHLLRAVTGAPPFYTEVFGVDYTTNALLLGHAGYHDASNADLVQPVRIVADIEYENSDPYTGCVTYFKYREGPVTVVNSVWDGERLKWSGFEGNSLAGPYKLEGNCHLVCRLQTDAATLLKDAVSSGVSQHWVVVPGHVLGEIGELCNIADIGFTRVG